MNKVDPTIGNKIKYARELKGWSQRELARRAEMSSGYIGSVENHTLVPSVKSLKKIAEALNVTTAFLLEQESGTLIDEFWEHLTPEEKSFIAKQELRPWITLSSELSSKGLSPDKVKSLIQLAIKLSEELDK